MEGPVDEIGPKLRAITQWFARAVESHARLTGLDPNTEEPLTTLDVINLRSDDDGVPCPCGAGIPLDLAQPDKGIPEALVGTCPECGRSLLLYDRDTDGPDFVALVLPSREELLRDAPPPAA
jgi:hypothetical protein